MKGSVATAALLGLVTLPAAHGHTPTDEANDLYASVSTKTPYVCKKVARGTCRSLRLYQTSQCKAFYVSYASQYDETALSCVVPGVKCRGHAPPFRRSRHIGFSRWVKLRRSLLATRGTTGSGVGATAENI